MLSNRLTLELFASEFSIWAATTLDRVHFRVVDLHRSLVGYFAKCDHHSISFRLILRLPQLLLEGGSLLLLLGGLVGHNHRNFIKLVCLTHKLLHSSSFGLLCRYGVVLDGGELTSAVVVSEPNRVLALHLLSIFALLFLHLFII